MPVILSALDPVPDESLLPALDYGDRCDACNARAYAVALFLAGPLYFCAHHWRKHQTAVRALTSIYTDNTPALAASVLAQKASTHA